MEYADSRRSAVQVYFLLMCYQVWQRTGKGGDSVVALKPADDEEDLAEIQLPSADPRVRRHSRVPSYSKEPAAGLPNYITERLSGLPRYSVIVIPPGATVSVTTENNRGVSMTSTLPARSISVSSTVG